MTSSAKDSPHPPRRLHGAASAYLQQHADNPVDWHPWEEAAFAAAKAQNKPIFLSIGYSTCYWCHVMEQDVFDNQAIADKMNAWFINIKVDREERPEVDEIYMSARQLITHQGGWPNNVFLTPDLKPFYAVGTMAPDNRYGQIPFPELLEKIHNTWTAEQKKVMETAEETARAIQTLMVRAESERPQALDPGIPDSLFSFMENYYDDACGGFFQEPKFPHESYLLFLLDYHRRKQSDAALKMADHSLVKMAAGGVHDHVGGGFHRYAIDRAWRVPHFEKMLYNQALMAKCYAEICRTSDATNGSHRETAERILTYVSDNMTDGGGGFYAALDAETGGVEGAYYAWEEDELKSVLSKEEFRQFSKYYDLEEIPTFPGHQPVKGRVLFARDALLKLADKGGKDYQRQKDALNAILNTLHAHRRQRSMPHMDTKIVTGWNGLMIDAFATAGQAFSSAEYLLQAERAARFLLEHARNEDGGLSRMWSGGQAHHRAYLEDYSFLIAGLLSLYRANPSEEWLREARQLLEKADSLFLDKEHGTYFFTDGRDRMITRIRKGSDSALPSCTGIMVSNFLELHEITGEKIWLDRARNKLLAYAGAMKEHPAEYTSMVQALLRMESEGWLA